MTLPVIVDGNFKVFGATQVLVNYLENSKPKLHILYPAEKKAEIDKHLSWFGSVLRPSSKRIITLRLR